MEQKHRTGASRLNSARPNRGLLTQKPNPPPSSSSQTTQRLDSPICSKPCRCTQTSPIQKLQILGNRECSVQRVETVGEVMTAGQIYTVTPETPVNEALELVVDKRITGLPVVDGRNRVVGVVSDFDLLAIDLPGEAHTSMFPSLDQSWEVFNALQTMIAKSDGKIVEDVMTSNPIVVRAETSIHSAARLLLESKTRRLPVVDGDGTLIGVLTRRDIVTAALALRRQHPEYFEDNLFN